MNRAERNKLVVENLPLVGYLVSEVWAKARHLSRDDLASAGALALITSADAFNPDLGVPFGAFARRRIIGAFADDMRSSDWATRSARRRIKETVAVQETLAAHGRIDALVNAAGINPRAHFLSADEAPFERMWQVNSLAPMRVIRAAWPALVAGGTGRVLNIASLSGKRVRNDNTGYAMSKFALMALTQAVRREGFARGVRATALAPGFVATDMTMAADFDRGQMTAPEDLAELAFTVLHLPNTATIAELLVNCRHETQL